MLSDEQQMIRDNVLRLCERFDDGYWLARDRDGEFPREFVAAFAAGGWIGTAMPEEYGGAGLGVTEAALAMQAVAESGCGHVRRLCGAYLHLRAPGHREAWQRGAAPALPAAPDRRAATSAPSA